MGERGRVHVHAAHALGVRRQPVRPVAGATRDLEDAAAAGEGGGEVAQHGEIVLDPSPRQA
jgi:hypothetical protein